MEDIINRYVWRNGQAGDGMDKQGTVCRVRKFQLSKHNQNNALLPEKEMADTQPNHGGAHAHAGARTSQ